MTGAKPLVLALSSPSSGSTEAADAAVVIAERFLPDLLYAAEKARERTHDVPREDEEAKLSLMARVGKVVDKQGMVSKMSWKCTVQEDGKLAIDKEAIAVGQSFATVRWIMEWVRAEVDTSNDKVRERVQSVVFDMSIRINFVSSRALLENSPNVFLVHVHICSHLNEHPARVVHDRYGGPDGEREPPLERGSEPLGEDLRGEQERVRGHGGDPRGVPGPEAVEDVERRERGAGEEPAHDVRGEEEALGAEEDGRRRVGLPGALREVCNFGFVAAAVEQDFITYPEKVLEMRKGFIVLGKDDDFCA
ncbi:hypothetical protein TRIUR3_21412 [Triticum urartu]|uniref:DUF7903 domain-containing protein n=1 Tax=Triticum urartu TaxID=4572 RepID=M7YEJ4_TRIUA|nr:hypothetical protein TRIUR3_21412 [Triticum urartu]